MPPIHTVKIVAYKKTTGVAQEVIIDHNSSLPPPEGRIVHIVSDIHEYGECDWCTRLRNRWRNSYDFYDRDRKDFKN